MARPAFKRAWTRVVPEADRAQHVRACFEPRAHPAVLAVASDGRSRLGGRSARSPGSAVALFCARAGSPCSSRRSSSITSISSGCARSGCISAASRTRRSRSDARPVPLRPPSALRRLAARILGDAHHDRGAPRLRARDHRLHPDRDSARGARSHPRARRLLRRYRERVPMLLPWSRTQSRQETAARPAIEAR